MLVCFVVWWHINLLGLFNAKSSLLKQWWYYLTHSWEDKGVHTFPKGICPKVNLIAPLEFELAYYDIPHSIALTITPWYPTSSCNDERIRYFFLFKEISASHKNDLNIVSLLHLSTMILFDFWWLNVS